MNGRSWQRSRNLDALDSWTNTYRVSFWVDDLNAPITVTLENADGTTSNLAADNESRFSHSRWT